MGEKRIPWRTPPPLPFSVYTGIDSQNSELQLHKDLADFVSKMLEEKQREMESSMGEDFNGLEQTLWWWK